MVPTPLFLEIYNSLFLEFSAITRQMFNVALSRELYNFSWNSLPPKIACQRCHPLLYVLEEETCNALYDFLFLRISEFSTFTEIIYGIVHIMQRGRHNFPLIPFFGNVYFLSLTRAKKKHCRGKFE